MKNLSVTRLIVFLFGIIAVGALGGCMKDDNNYEYPQSVLTMVNGYVGATGVTYASDNSSIVNLAYKNYDRYLIFPGSRRIRIFDNANEELADEIYTFKDSTYYTSFIYGWQEDVHHLITEDKLLSNLNDQMGIRFLHLSPSEGKVSLYINDQSTLLYGVRGYEGENDAEENTHILFTPQNSGTQNLIVTNEDDEVLIEREYNFEKGAYYSIILIGDGNSQAMPLYLGVVAQYRQ